MKINCAIIIDVLCHLLACLVRLFWSKLGECPACRGTAPVLSCDSSGGRQSRDSCLVHPTRFLEPRLRLYRKHTADSHALTGIQVYCNAIVLSATPSLVDRYLQVEFQQVGGEEVNRDFGVVEVGDT